MAQYAKHRPYRSRSRRRLQKGLEPQVVLDEQPPQNHQTPGRTTKDKNQQQQSHDQQETGPRFQVGDILQDQWRVDRLLSKGSFGVVYEASDVHDPKNRVAVKTEPIVTNMQLLRIELDVLIALQGKSNHVTALFSAGHTRELNYIVMSLLGKTLMELKKSTPQDRFTIPTVLRMGCQMLKALEDLHAISYIHRDVKPANFAIDRSANGRKNRGLVYIFDFGLCRQFRLENGRMRDPRSNVPFRGTVRYASIDVLAGKDMGRHDDLWSMFYVLSEMANSQLPWRRIVDKEKVRQLKQSSSLQYLWRNMPQETWAVVEHLRSLNFHSTPNYDLIGSTFNSALQRLRVNEQTTFDWESATEVDHAQGDDEPDDDKSLAVGRSE